MSTAHSDIRKYTNERSFSFSPPVGVVSPLALFVRSNLLPFLVWDKHCSSLLPVLPQPALGLDYVANPGVGCEHTYLGASPASHGLSDLRSQRGTLVE